MKGVFGKVLTMVISLVLAALALILIWYFNEKLFGYFGALLLEGLKSFFCSMLGFVGKPFGC